MGTTTDKTAIFADSWQPVKLLTITPDFNLKVY